MSETVLIKKRGRPKKVTPATDTTINAANELPPTLKKSASTKKGVADQIPTAQDVPAKKSRRKTVKSTTTADDAGVSSTKVIDSLSTPTVVADAPTSIPVIDDQGEVKSAAVISEPESETRSPMQTTPDSSAARTVASSTAEELTSSVSEAVNEQAPSTQQESVQSTSASNHQRSSFLSSFLDKDYQEEAPSISESAKISDRSAFTQQQISFEDIVKGDGVSTVPPPKSTSPASSPISSSIASSPKPQPATTVEQSHFLPLKIRAFPDSRQPASAPIKTRLNIPPESFSSSSFMAFRESAALQARSKPNPIKPSPPPPSTFSRASRAPPTQPLPTDKPKYTDMSYDQLKKLPEYKAKRWFWTKMMVGIPVSLVASWFLWKRLEEWQGQRKKMLGDLGEGPRQRGVLNSRSPDVGANGSV